MGQEKHNHTVSNESVDGIDLHENEIVSVSAHVKKVIRRRMHASMKPRFDSVDFMQMAWASFFRFANDLDKFTDSVHLENYVTSVARNKVGEAFRKNHIYQKHNVRRELTMDDVNVDDLEVDLTDSPSAITQMKEFWLRLNDICNSRETEIINRRIAGCTNQEIADELGLHERTIRKILARIAATIGV